MGLRYTRPRSWGVHCYLLNIFCHFYGARFFASVSNVIILWLGLGNRVSVGVSIRITIRLVLGLGLVLRLVLGLAPSSD